ncbi:AAA family ATPase [Gracilimonas sediminicola]|uniref:AAA family ATPase n=1 Tax=Gracilimonas sediminicola TaxID=2952158 RepID=UPI0038D35AE2
MKKLNQGSAISPTELITKVHNTPPVPLIWRGIKEGSLGFIFGPSKTGKTLLAENLAYNIAARNTSFLGTPLKSYDKKVLIVSLEEPNTIKRGDRNLKALSSFPEEELQRIDENLTFFDDYEPHIWEPSQWNHLIEDVSEVAPDIVFIDSLTHLYAGEIESSRFAQQLTKRLRLASDELNITLAIIHHTPKLNGFPITIDSLAGSRILAQEAEFMIGVNRSFNNTRYLKDVAYRYQREQEKVLTFDIGEDFRLVEKDEVYENTLIRELDGRVDHSTREQILSFVEEKSEDSEDGLVTTSDIKGFIDKSDTQVQEWLTKLVNEGKLTKPKRGYYTLNN